MINHFWDFWHISLRQRRNQRTDLQVNCNCIGCCISYDTNTVDIWTLDWIYNSKMCLFMWDTKEFLMNIFLAQHGQSYSWGQCLDSTCCRRFEDTEYCWLQALHAKAFEAVLTIRYFTLGFIFCASSIAALMTFTISLWTWGSNLRPRPGIFKSSSRIHLFKT